MAETPDAVQKLRSLILDLAVRGRLVPQDPSEARPSLPRAKEVPIKSADLPFVVPPNWTSLKLGQALTLEYGSNLPARSRNTDGKFPVYGSNGVVGTHDEFLVASPCIVIGRKGSSGAVNLSEGRCWPTDVAYYVVPPEFLELRFTFLLLKALRLDLLGKGIKPGLNRNEAYELPIALPPLPEQRRIVAKVEELLALCDQLEARQTTAREHRARLVHSALDHLTAAKDEQDFRNRASFIFRHSTLNPQPSAVVLEDVSALRQAILSLAVRGRLVPQKPQEEPASAFLSKIKRASTGSALRNRTTGEDDANPKFTAHLPGELPTAWAVSPLEDLFRFVDYRGRTPPRRPSGVRLITAKNVRRGYVSDEPIEFIDEDLYPRWMTRGLPNPGDLLFVTEGHTMGFVGMLSFDFKYALAQRTIALQPFIDGYSRFYLYCLQSDSFQDAIAVNATGSAAKGIKAAKLKRIRVVVPPLAEQARIVAKVEELMCWCDQLEAHLATARTTGAHLLDACLNQILNPAQTDAQTSRR